MLTFLIPLLFAQTPQFDQLKMKPCESSSVTMLTKLKIETKSLECLEFKDGKKLSFLGLRVDAKPGSVTRLWPIVSGRVHGFEVQTQNARLVRFGDCYVQGKKGKESSCRSITNSYLKEAVDEWLAYLPEIRSYRCDGKNFELISENGKYRYFEQYKTRGCKKDGTSVIHALDDEGNKKYIALESTYEQGELSGTQKSYWPNGKKRFEVLYLAGRWSALDFYDEEEGLVLKSVRSWQGQDRRTITEYRTSLSSEDLANYSVLFFQAEDFLKSAGIEVKKVYSGFAIETTVTGTASPKQRVFDLNSNREIKNSSELPLGFAIGS